MGIFHLFLSSPSVQYALICLSAEPLSSPAQRLLPRPHPRGAVPLGQRGGHEPSGLRPHPLQRGEGGADLSNVGL